MATPIKGKRPVETENNTSPDKRKMKQAKTQAGAAASGTAGQNKPAAAGKPQAAKPQGKPQAGKPPAAKKQGGGVGSGSGSGAGAGAAGKPKAKPAPKKEAKVSAAAEEDLGSADSGSDGDDDGDALAGIDQEALSALDEVQERLQAIDSKLQYEKLVLERKYNEEKAPGYAARGKVIREKLPDFWMSVLLAHEGLRSLFSDEIDAEALAALTDLTIVDLKAPDLGYTIAMTFDASKNPLFSNTKLEKTYRFVKLTAAEKDALAKAAADAAGNDDDGAVAPSAEFRVAVSATTVKFKDATPKAEERHMQSFFYQWFDAEAAEEDNTEDTVAEIIRSEIWPNPLALYLDSIDGGLPDDLAADDDDDDDVAEDGADDL